MNATRSSRRPFRPRAMWTLALLLAAGATLAPGAAGAAAAKDKNIKRHPGYIDLERIEIPAGAREVQDIDLTPALMQAAAGAEADGGGAMSKLLSRLAAIRVKSFSADKAHTERIRGHIERLDKRMRAENWQRLVYVKDGDETVSVNVKPGTDGFAGLLIIAFEPGDQATFVNIVGDLNLPALFELAGELLKEGKLENLLEGVGQGSP